MHQTFYIDADEEISSVIDRLNRSMSATNYFVVPQRAIFLLSVINLKLLKSEAEKIGKRLVIVTQDEIGASMAERAGLEVKRTIDDVESRQQFAPSHQEDVIEDDVFIEDYEDSSDELQSKKARLKGVGTDNFYAEAGDSEKRIAKSSHVEKTQAKRIKVNGVFDMRNESKISQPTQSHARRSAQDIYNHSRTNSGGMSGKIVDNEKTKTLEKMYSSIRDKQKKSDNEKIHVVSGSSKKIFIGFISLCLLLFVFIAGYLFLPSAKITIVPNVLSEKIDITAQGSLDLNVDLQNNLKIRIIEKEKETTLSYAIGGQQGEAGKKAHGKVVIYNEYSNASQTLIATTRLESGDGKIFRLVKNVVVPGTTLVGGEVKSGVIEAEVVADQAGEDFNLEPTSFKIPGFKDSPKYEKFSAKSTENFTGGSLDGGSGASSLITQKDLDNAKQKTESAVSDELKKSVTDELIEGEILLDQAEKVSISKSVTKNKVGIAADKVDYTVDAKIKTLVFVEDDVKKMLIQELKKKVDVNNAKFEISKLDYGLSVADFDKNALELKIRGDFSIVEDVDIEKVKRQLLGKKDGQIEDVIKSNAGIKNANIEFSIPFISQIPQYASRVEIEIGK